METVALLEISKPRRPLPRALSLFHREGELRWLSDFTAKQMRRSGNRETVLLPAQFILQFCFFYIRFSASSPFTPSGPAILRLYWLGQEYAYFLDTPLMRIHLFLHSVIAVFWIVVPIFPLIPGNNCVYLRCWKNTSAAISILDYF